MKKILFLLILFLLSVNIMMTSAETKDGSVTDFFNQDQSESIEPDVDADDQMTDQEELDNAPVLVDDHSPSVVNLIIRIVVILALIIGLIYLLLKLFNRTGSFNKQGDVLVNLGGLSLGTNKSIQMIQVGEKIFLIGVGETISLLTEITDPSVKQKILDGKESPNIQMSDLIHSFKLNKEKKVPDLSKTQGDSDDNFASLFKSELDTLKEKRANIRSKYKEED